MLREVTRILNDAYKTVVVVVDTTSLHGGSHLWDALIGSRNPLHFVVLCNHGADTGILVDLRSDSISLSTYLHTAREINFSRQPLEVYVSWKRITETAKSQFSSCSVSEREHRLGSAPCGLFRGHLHPESWNPSRCLPPKFTDTWSASGRLPTSRR